MSMMDLTGDYFPYYITLKMGTDWWWLLYYDIQGKWAKEELPKPECIPRGTSNLLNTLFIKTPAIIVAM